MAENYDIETDSDDLADEALDRNESGKLRMCCSCTNRKNDSTS
ncbi:MAG: hypothetical protein O3A96_09600 [Proteobacteria bacterium]|nr:hypothetical protein [Pseudomonadota bacterium]